MDNQETELKVEDRVKRKNAPGCYGTIREICEEVTASTGDTKDKALLVKVHWDNGTTSVFAPESLEQISE